MMLLAALDVFEELLAANTGFQTMTGTANATAAAARIYRDFLPDPANANEHTLAELQAIRPFAMVYKQEANGWQAQRDASGNCWRISGVIIVRFEWGIPYSIVEGVSTQSITDFEAAEQFQTHVSRILYNDSGNGILQSTSSMNLFEISELGCYRTPPEHIPTFGDCYAAEYAIRWGAGR